MLAENEDLANEKDPYGVAPLHLAAQRGHLDIVKALVKYGANQEIKENHTSTNPKTPLMAAVGANQIEVAEFLLEKGANPNAGDDDGWAPLHSATANGNLRMVKALVKYGATVDVKTETGTTPLMMFLMHAPPNTAETVEFLAENKANVDLADNLGDTAMHYAVREGNVDAVQALIKHSARIDVDNNDGKTPQSIAEEKGFLQIIEILQNAVKK